MRNTLATKLLFELSQPGRRGSRIPACDVPAQAVDELLPSAAVADVPPPLPEVAEPDVVRHFSNLSTMNMSVDTHFYSPHLAPARPAGSGRRRHQPLPQLPLLAVVSAAGYSGSNRVDSG